MFVFNGHWVTFVRQYMLSLICNSVDRLSISDALNNTGVLK